MKIILLYISMTLTLMTLSACGGGGESAQTPSSAKTRAVLTINLTGNLLPGITIAGASFTLVLPANVTPALINGEVATGVVSLSGTFAGGTQTPPVYTAPTINNPGTLRVFMANPVTTGVTQAGEVATITLQLANGATPTIGSFGVNGVSVINATLYNPISGMGATIATLTLQ